MKLSRKVTLPAAHENLYERVARQNFPASNLQISAVILSKPVKTNPRARRFGLGIRQTPPATLPTHSTRPWRPLVLTRAEAGVLGHLGNPAPDYYRDGLIWSFSPALWRTPQLVYGACQCSDFCLECTPFRAIFGPGKGLHAGRQVTPRFLGHSSTPASRLDSIAYLVLILRLRVFGFKIIVLVRTITGCN